jgi:hypothetical protein
MSDASDYLLAHAKLTLLRARRLPPGPVKSSLRRIGGVYHLLAKQGAYSNIEFLDDFRIVKDAEQSFRRQS